MALSWCHTKLRVFRVHQRMSDCYWSHQECPRDKPSKHPTRLLDLSEEVPKPVENSQGGQFYMCLSHFWGLNGSPCMTTKANLNSHKEGIFINSLSATFRDAITVARLLDIRYLWINSLVSSHKHNCLV
jgi:hypothetical protein